MRRVFAVIGFTVATLSMFTVTAGAAEQAAAAAAAAPAAPAETPKAPGAAEPLTLKTFGVTLRVPLMSPHFETVPVALVNGEPILLEELAEALATVHAEGPQEQERTKMSSVELLNRLITVRLVVHEAKEMGLDELPELKELIDANARMTLRSELLEELGKGVALDPADEPVVEKAYKEKVREWKVSSLVLGKEEEAQKLQDELKAGKSFAELVARANEEKLAVAAEEGRWVKPEELQLPIAEEIAKLEPGRVSPTLRTALGKREGFMILKLEEFRYPEVPAAREQARTQVLARKTDFTVREKVRELYKKLIKVNTKLIKGLDFEAPKPGMAQLLKDTRAVVEIKGEKPITVGDLAKGLKEKFYHGVEQAASSKRVNKHKDEMLAELTDKRVLRKEALRRGLDKSPSYLKKLKQYEDASLFGAFVNKALVPSVALSEEDVKAYYENNKDKYTYPEMVTLSSLAFTTLDDAKAAQEKLQKGADFKWVKANAERQVEPAAKGLVTFNGTLLTSGSLDDGVHKAIAGAQTGEFRLYQSPENYFYVLAVQNMAPSRTQPYEEVRSAAAPFVFQEKVREALDSWAAKLREAAKPEVFLVEDAK